MENYFRRNLALWRSYLDLTAPEMSMAIGFDHAKIGRLERGQEPMLSDVRAIADFLKVSESDLCYKVAVVKFEDPPPEEENTEE